MRRPPIPALLLALATPVLLAADLGTDDGIGGQVTTMTFHERIIIRVPRLAGPPPPQAQPMTWKEHRGPKCIVAADLAGALVSEPGMVDLVLKGNRRVRARLDDRCEPLDFYNGFYVKPSADGRICADRDSIRARSGLSCQIDAFRLLKPVKDKP